jgi:hypothetical protein
VEGGEAGDSDGGAADTRGSVVMRTEERGRTVVAALMSALLSSSSRAVSRWPYWADTIRAVQPSCTCAAGRKEEGAESWGWWSSGQLACALTSCARLRMHGCSGGEEMGERG